MLRNDSLVFKDQCIYPGEKCREPRENLTGQNSQQKQSYGGQKANSTLWDYQVVQSGTKQNSKTSAEAAGIPRRRHG